MKCLLINIDSFNEQPQFIFIDSLNALHYFTIDFLTDEVSVKNHSKSEPLDYYIYSNNFKSKLGLSYEWEIWFFAVTKHITLSNQRFEFVNQVGIVFGLNKNRRNILVKEEKEDFLLEKYDFEDLTQEANE